MSRILTFSLLGLCLVGFISGLNHKGNQNPFQKSAFDIASSFQPATQSQQPVAPKDSKEQYFVSAINTIVGWSLVEKESHLALNYQFPRIGRENISSPPPRTLFGRFLRTIVVLIVSNQAP